MTATAKPDHILPARNTPDRVPKHSLFDVPIRELARPRLQRHLLWLGLNEDAQRGLPSLSGSSLHRYQHVVDAASHGRHCEG